MAEYKKRRAEAPGVSKALFDVAVRWCIDLFEEYRLEHQLDVYCRDGVYSNHEAISPVFGDEDKKRRNRQGDPSAVSVDAC